VCECLCGVVRTYVVVQVGTYIVANDVHQLDPTQIVDEVVSERPRT